MRQVTVQPRGGFSCAAALGVALLATQAVLAQPQPQGPQVPNTNPGEPPVHYFGGEGGGGGWGGGWGGGGGATPLSAQIQAEASYLRGMGEFLEDAAVARRHNALAREQEMKNALTWVQTYFEARALNRAYRLKENPSYLDREKKHQEVIKDKITKYFQDVLKGDVTGQLNWMLHELSGPTMAYQYLPGDKSLSESKLDEKLSPNDIYHIRLTDGGKKEGKLLTFRADSATVLETNWPRALRGSEFEQVRTQFEAAREQLLKEAKEGKMSNESQEKLRTAIDDVVTAFNETYPRDERVKSSADFLTYNSGKHFLQTLAAGVYRAIETNDRWVFDGSYSFKGGTLVELMQHMYRNGLGFGPPEPGDEGVYDRLFLAMRNIYLNLSPDAPAAGK
jgi:hypothetical protein